VRNALGSFSNFECDGCTQPCLKCRVGTTKTSKVSSVGHVGKQGWQKGFKLVYG